MGLHALQDLTYRDLPAGLIAGSSEPALAKARRTLEAGGLRVGDAVPIEQARARVAQQAAASVLWIEIDRDGGGAMDAFLEFASGEVLDGRYPAVVSTAAETIDAVAARIPLENIQLLVDADDAERAAALALAIVRPASELRVADVAADKNAARLRQLSDEVSRIAATLARLSTGPSASGRRPEVEISGNAPDVSVETVRAIIRARRLRSRYFPEELFADPAWDMLLDLLQAEIAKLRVPVSSLCIAAAVPATTALRWLKAMVQEGIFVRRADPHDGRRVFVELAPQTSDSLRRYFAEVGQVAVI
jgi:DNA-binding MarR family transcriptional regulator